MRMILFLVMALLLGQAVAQEPHRQLIWGQVPIVKSANYAEFNAELSRTRAQARRQLVGEFAALLIPLAGSTDDVVRLAQVLANTIQRFDDLARKHAHDAHEGVGVALQDDFKAGIESLMRQHRLSDAARRTGLTWLPRQQLDAVRAANVPVEDALTLVRELRWVAYGSYAVLERAEVRVTLHLEELVTGRVRSFSAQAAVADAGGLLARRVTDFLQGVEYPEWDNPQPHLTWIAPASPQAKVRAEVAARYCEGQRARLPYAAELLQATFGGPYREGGIDPLHPDSYYIVADRNHFDEPHYYNTWTGAQQQTGGPITTAAGLGVITGYYWCVRGEPAHGVLLDQALYRMLRENRERGRDGVVAALEYLLASRGEESVSSMSFDDGDDRPTFSSLSGALRFLADNGVHVNIH